MAERVALITGASSGLGRHTALALARAGFSVVAGARSFNLPQTHLPMGIACLPLDVTDEAAVQAFVQQAYARYGKIDVLINCAGILALGACEEIPCGEYKRIMETNFFAMAALIQAVLPIMRERHGGRIVNFSSINGLLGIPFQSAYTASKHAIEGYSECLRMECAPHGIEVMLVEPGDHRGGSPRYRTKISGIIKDDLYQRDRERAIKVIERDEAGGLDPDKLGDKVAKALLRKRLPFRLRIAKWDQHLAAMLHTFFPADLFFAIISRYYLGKRRK